MNQHHFDRRWSPLLCLATSALMAIGCHLGRAKAPVPAAHTVYQSPNLASSDIRRVLLLPVANQTSNLVAGERFYELLASEIAGIRCFETVRLNRHEAAYLECETDMRSGRYSEQTLVKLRNIYNVDAIAFTSLKDFHAYWPPRFSASMQMVETSTGETVWSVDGVWDARNGNVSQMAQRSFRNSTTGRLIGDSELVLQSPEYMGKFVACQMAGSLKNSWPPLRYEMLNVTSGVAPTSYAQDTAAREGADPSAAKHPTSSGETIRTPVPEPSELSPVPSTLPQPSPPPLSRGLLRRRQTDHR